MATPLFSVGGLASGLDTTSIISQLMQLERQPVIRFQQRQAELRKVDDAWGTITTKLSGVRAAVDKLSVRGGIAATMKVSSSDEAAVTASKTGSPSAGTVSFTVERLATAHQIAAGGTFTSAEATVGAGQFILTGADGTTLGTVTTTAGTTLQQLSDQINQLGAGVSSQVVQTDTDSYRLVLSATKTGDDAQFTVTSDLAGFATSTVLATGQDAHLKLGTLDVYRSGNTVTDLVPGVSVNLKQAASGKVVTVTTQQDVDGVVTNVKALVDAVNGVLKTLKDLSSYNADTKVSGPLQGDPDVRKLTLELRSVISGAVGGLSGEFTTPSSVGISLDRYGAVTLDETKLRAALAKDPGAVAGLFEYGATASDAEVRVITRGRDAQDGTYALEVTQAATTASKTSTYTKSNQDQTFTIVTDEGVSVNVLVPRQSTIDEALAAIQGALQTAGVTTITASKVGGDLLLKETRYGSAVGFSVESTGTAFGLKGTYAGQDVRVRVDGGAEVTGSGRKVTFSGGLLDGTVLEVSATTARAAGSLTLTKGLAAGLDGVLRLAEGSALADGMIKRARDTLKGQIKRYDDQIAAFDVRLQGREKTLRQKFAALESAMSRLQGQGSWLASQLGVPQG